MTPAQKHNDLLNQVKELLDTLDKVDACNGKLYQHQARQQRKQLKIYVMQNRITAKTVSDAARREAPTLFTYHQNWLGQ